MTDHGLPHLPAPPTEPSLPPPPPAPSFPPPPPDPPPPPNPRPPGKDSSRGWLVAAIVVAALAAARSGVRAAADGEAAGYVVGTVIGSLAVVVAIGAVVGRLASRRAGLIAIVVVGAVILGGAIAGDVNRQRTANEIREAADDLGLASDPEFTPTDQERDCLDGSGFDPDDLLIALTDTGAVGAARQLDWFDAIAACAPRALLTDANVTEFREVLSAGLSVDITDAEARCVVSELARSTAPSELFISGDVEAVAGMFATCLSEESLAALRREAGTGPQDFGDDATFDRLAGRCRDGADRDGADMACDILFDMASVGSAYSALSEDCAGRGLSSPTTCTAGFLDDDVDGFLDDASPGWADVVESCRAGEMVACDFAFTFSEFGGQNERVGETCGERHALATAESCVERYGDTAG